MGHQKAARGPDFRSDPSHGGLGQMLYFHLALFQQAPAMAVLLAMLVLAVDVASRRLRQGLAAAHG